MEVTLGAKTNSLRKRSQLLEVTARAQETHCQRCKLKLNILWRIWLFRVNDLLWADRRQIGAVRDSRRL